MFIRIILDLGFFKIYFCKIKDILSLLIKGKIYILIITKHLVHLHVKHFLKDLCNYLFKRVLLFSLHVKLGF